MAVTTHVRTFSIDDLKVATLTGETVGTLVDVPGIRTCEVSLTTEEEELRGDSKVISIVDKGQGLEWKFEEGGISLQALSVVTGKALAESGVTPNQVGRMDFLSSDSRPYFWLTGRSLDDAGGDIQVVIWRAKAIGNIEVNLSDENFLIPSLEGRGIGRASDDRLMSLLYHETKTALANPG